MKIPRITINADFGNDAFLGELNLLSVGYGIHQAWIYATMFAASSLFRSSTIATSEFGSHVTLAYLTSVIVFGVLLIATAALSKQLLSFYTSRKSLVGAIILMTLGTGLLFFESHFAMQLPVVMTISGILTGIGSGVVIIFWGTAFSREETETVAINTALSIVIAFTLYALVLQELPYPFGGIVAMLLPLAELPILLKVTPPSFEERGAQPIFHLMNHNAGKFAWKFGLPVFFLGIALGSLRQTTLQSVLPASTQTSQLIVMLAAGFTAFILIPVAIIYTRNSSWNRFFKPVLLVVTIAAFFLPLFLLGNTTIATFFIIIGYLCFEAMLWMYFAEMSITFRITPLITFGIGRGVLALSSLVSAVLPLLFDQINTDVTITGWSSIIIIVSIMAALLLIPGEKELMNIVAPCPLIHVITADTPLTIDTLAGRGTTPTAEELPADTEEDEEEFPASGVPATLAQEDAATSPASSPAPIASTSGDYHRDAASTDPLPAASGGFSTKRSNVWQRCTYCPSGRRKSCSTWPKDTKALTSRRSCTFPKVLPKPIFATCIASWAFTLSKSS